MIEALNALASLQIVIAVIQLGTLVYTLVELSNLTKEIEEYEQDEEQLVFRDTEAIHEDYVNKFKTWMKDTNMR